MVYCSCGGLFVKTTTAKCYNHDQNGYCGCCKDRISRRKTIYHCGNSNCFDYCENCCKCGTPKGDTRDYRCVFDVKPFDSGQCRYAFLGIGVRAEFKGQKVVVKKFKNKTPYNDTDWAGDIAAHKKAIEFVDEWNKLKIVNKKYIITVPTISHIKWSGDSICEDGEYVMIEKFIEGDYEKWNSNGGWVSNKAAVSSIQAFCHFTYHYSNGTLVMCDAQGVRGQDTYHITDPAIISRWGGAYGATDLGREGLENFMARHRCNDWCDKNWLKPKKKTFSINIKPMKHTTYRWSTKQPY